MVPKLKFNSEIHKSEHHRFSEIVFRSLLSHKAPVLESLHLLVRDQYESLDVGIWIGIAFSRHVRKLVVDLHNQREVLARFPSVLWSYTNTLETLKLENSILLDIPSSVCLKSLRKLHLDYVQFEDEESISNLFRGCPRLEDLVVNRKSIIDVKTFTIAVPSLHRLIIEDYFAGEGDGGYVINAPCLKYLKIEGFEWLEFCLIVNAPELAEAKIKDVSYINNENILSSLTSARRLSLYLLPFKIKYPTGIFFYQLVYLELYTLKRWNLLSLMLDSSPKLQTLKLIDTFMWKRYDWQREDEKEVVIYILENARRLKKAFISTKPIKSKELEKLEQSREMLKELASVVRASNSCHLVCETETY